MGGTRVNPGEAVDRVPFVLLLNPGAVVDRVLFVLSLTLLAVYGVRAWWPKVSTVGQRRREAERKQLIEEERANHRRAAAEMRRAAARRPGASVASVVLGNRDPRTERCPHCGGLPDNRGLYCCHCGRTVDVPTAVALTSGATSLTTETRDDAKPPGV